MCILYHAPILYHVHNQKKRHQLIIQKLKDAIKLELDQGRDNMTLQRLEL